MHTISEKTRDRWQRRLAERLDAKIAELEATRPRFLPSIRAHAEDQMLRQLGLSRQWHTYQQLSARLSRIEVEKREIEREIVAVVRGVPAATLGEHATLRAGGDVELRMAALRGQIELQLLSQTPHGQQLAKLLVERANLADTVLVAGSTKAMQALWVHFSELVGDHGTPLQRAAFGSKV